jgi:adenine-specific DNA methylase/predicted AAA+ superfamily ATPase
MTYRKKLIEVALPLDAINKESAREKTIRHGHPSTLHLWWARRPLAACRAVLFTSLVDDPSEHPEKFPSEQDQEQERLRLFRLIEELIQWDNSNNEEVLAKARIEIHKATNGNLPSVLDPFAGGGTIPLEAQRLGLESHASDLNPVAVLINKALIEIPPKFAGRSPVNPEAKKSLIERNWNGAQGIADDIRYYGNWIRNEAEGYIGYLYPKVKLPNEFGGGEASVIAWLWARTVTCPNPACGAAMPLITSFYLSKKKGNEVWIEPEIDNNIFPPTVNFSVKFGKGEPPDPPKVGRGAQFKCLCCGNVASEQHVKNEGMMKRMGAQLMTIVAERKGKRIYIPPTVEHSNFAAMARPKWRPDQELGGDKRAIWCPLYGLTTFADLFTPRQLVTLTTFGDLIQEARDRVLTDAKLVDLYGDDESFGNERVDASDYADAVVTYLALALDKMTTTNTSICTWQTEPTRLVAAFGRQAIPMAWDYAEANPFGEAAGDYSLAIKSLAEVLDRLCPISKGVVRQLDAISNQSQFHHLVSTDPPYYDNIGYADLSDYFYVWLRRSLCNIYPDLFSTMLVPKAQELVAIPYRFGGNKDQAKHFFEEGLRKSFMHIREIQNPDYPLTVFYAFKQSEVEAESDYNKRDSANNAVSSTGWETMLEGLIRVGFTITGTWPIRTELIGNLKKNISALASSIVLVCRPRLVDAPIASRRQFLNALRAELPSALKNLQRGSIAPVDLAQASIGPGMAIYSRYSKVVESDGTPLQVRAALQLINRALDEALAEQEGEYDVETRWAVAWFEQYAMEAGDYGTAETLSKAKNSTIQSLVDAGFLEARAGKVRLLKREELSANWNPKTAHLTVWEVMQRMLFALLNGNGETGAGDILCSAEILNRGLQPFIEREMQAVFGTRWLQETATNLREYHLTSTRSGELSGDTQVLLMVMWDQWNTVFKNVLGHAERSQVSELREARNKWAHQEAFSTDDAYRTLDSVQRLLTSVSAAQQASEVERQKQELLRIRFDEQVRNETRKVAVAPIEGRPTTGLRPWREVVTPHPDVASGRYQQAEFAADLAQVHRGEGSDEYRVPRDFFQRTFLTHGLSRLLSDALQRISGSGGNPVVDLQTNFGGGKTHSLLALYHLFSGASTSDLVGIEPVLKAASLSQPPQAQRAVLVGYELSPGQPRTKPDGCLVYTLWGELAWQLLGKDGFAMVAEADRQGVSPGSEILRLLFTAAAPCLILIDEWVVYARQLYDVSGLPGGSFDANLSFAQSLTEAAKTAPQTLVVATIPASDTETGGEGGREAAVRLKNIFGRIESPWRPADTEEGFEIVRRRLFQNITEPALFIARDSVAKSYMDLYRSQPQDFPSHCREAEYERRIKAAYPIHPELFDRLYNDWSSIEKFQRTRGVLRLMAAVIHALWERQDASPLILPANVPIDESSVQAELTLYLEDNWMPVIEKDIDGPHSLPLRIDGENANLGRYSASRRVARTIYLGSAPNPRNANRGLAETQIKLGCVQPGENVAIFGDSLRRLSDQSTHLSLDGQRYWYDTRPTVSRLAQDRAAQLDEESVLEEIVKRLKVEQSNRGDFARVHVCPASGADIAEDDTSARLVILKPELAHALHDQHSKAREAANTILDLRGNTRRSYRNTLVFLAADRTRLEELKQGVRQYLSWDSIHQQSEPLNLDAFQRNQAKTKRDEANKSVVARIPETYTWLLVPDQPELRQSDELQELRLQPQLQNSLAANASRRLKTEEMLITQYAGTLLRREMDRIPLWRGNHVSIKELAENFARYVYLPRLKNTEVLLGAIREGVQFMWWERETFAYADGWDITRNWYLGLRAGQQVNVIINSETLLVKPEVAAAQLAEEATPVAPPQPAISATSMTYAEGQSRPNPVMRDTQEQQIAGLGSVAQSPAPFPTASPVAAKEEVQRLHRFHASVQINERMMARDAGTIMEEVVKHLTSLYGAKVKVTLEIEAELPNGVSESTVRAVMENCRTLRFESQGFEEE